MAVLTDMVTGLRKGEFLGLQRKYVDLVNCRIGVRWTLKLVKVYNRYNELFKSLGKVSKKN